MILDLERFHSLIKEREEEEGRKITYKILEEETGVSKHSIDDYHRVKNGKQNQISMRNLIKFGEYFDVHPHYLVGLSRRQTFNAYEYELYKFANKHSLTELVKKILEGEDDE